MKPYLRVAVYAIVIYTVAISPWLLGAFFGRSNDCGMIVCFTAYPSILLAGRDDRDLPIYASPDQRPSDHAAMVSDALTGWSTGCIQYGVLATVGYAVWRGVRPVAKSKV